MKLLLKKIKKIFLKFLFYFLKFVLGGFSIFSKNLLCCWLFIELNFYIRIPLIFFFSKKYKSNFIYFFINIIRGVLLFFFLILNKNVLFFWIGILLKLGVLFPIFWYPLILKNFDWICFPIILIGNKIPIFKLISYFSYNRKLILYLLILSFFVKRILLYSQNKKIKSFIAFSSTTQTGIMLIFFNKSFFFLFYFFFYSVTVVIICVILKFNWEFRYPFFFRILIFLKRGFPPSFIFFYKLIFLKIFKKKFFFLIILVMVMYINFIRYLNLVLSFFLNKKIIFIQNNFFIILRFFTIFFLLV